MLLIFLGHRFFNTLLYCNTSQYCLSHTVSSKVVWNGIRALRLDDGDLELFLLILWNLDLCPFNDLILQLAPLTKFFTFNKLATIPHEEIAQLTGLDSSTCLKLKDAAGKMGFHHDLQLRGAIFDLYKHVAVPDRLRLYRALLDQNIDGNYLREITPELSRQLGVDPR